MVNNIRTVLLVVTVKKNEPMCEYKASLTFSNVFFCHATMWFLNRHDNYLLRNLSTVSSVSELFRVVDRL